MNEAKKEHKWIAADDWIPVFIEMLEEGKILKLAPHGFSMYPFLVSDRDFAMLKKLDFPLKRGDIVLYRRLDGIHVLHRIHHIDYDKEKYYMLGDSQKWIEGPLEKKQLLAVAIQIIRKGKVYNCNSIVFRLLSEIWMRLRPIRGKIIHIWLHLQKIVHKGKIEKISKKRDEKNA